MGTGAWRLVGGARSWLAGAAGVGFGQAVLLVAQASVLARLLAGAMDGRLSAGAVDRGVLLIVLLAGGQAVAGWAWEACAEAAAGGCGRRRGGGRWRRPWTRGLLRRGGRSWGRAG